MNGDCDAIATDGVIERYVAGRLQPEAREAFEDHLVACARCQGDVRLAVTLRAELREPTRGATARPPRRWLMPAGLALAATIAAILWLPSRRDPALVALGAVGQAPIYLGVAVRATPATAESLFAAGMAAYDAGRYAVAVTDLDAALAAGVDAAPAEFFRAASLLLAGAPRPAVDGFRRVLSLGDTPYRPEARFYLAKALLQLGEGAAAVAQLRLVAADDELGRHARALADSVEVVLPR